MQPGRICPVDYRSAPHALAAVPVLECETVYAVGGLYGNAQALACVLDMAASEPAPATVVFNGDFNWFNVDAASFEAVNETVLQHVALRGNGETESASEARDAGCGCGYPAWVGDAEVERSNAILSRLRETAARHPRLCAALRELPMYAVARVGAVRVGIVHGDAGSLAGWRYAQESLADAGHRASVARDFEQANVRVIASSHTCLPVAVDCATALGRCALFNNGAAGMPNFAGVRCGVVTRIGVSPARSALYGTRIEGVHVDALAVAYDHEAWERAFLANWPARSPAHESYYRRIVDGPPYALAAAPRWRIVEPAGA